MSTSPAAALPTPDCLLPTPSQPLPPSARDFEIHRLNLVEFIPTRRVAEKFRISQTRVRQIVARVAQWLTNTLPIKNEQDVEREKRYAIHLAAAQLEHQIRHLQNFWDGTGDPKYLRQQTRTIQALARLGVNSTTLDALAADTESGFHPAKNEAHNHQDFNDDSSAPSPSVAPSLDPAIPPPPIPNPKSPIPNSSSPPPRDCSPSPAQVSGLQPQASAPNDETPSAETDLWLLPENASDTLKGLDLMEKNLLDYMSFVDPKQTQRLADLNQTLSEIRQSRANFIVKLGPNMPVTTSAPAAAQPINTFSTAN